MREASLLIIDHTCNSGPPAMLPPPIPATLHLHHAAVSTMV